jgi:uncharacterized protein YjiK
LPRPEVTELRWRDPPLAEIATPKGRMRLTLGVGSALSRRPGDPPGRVWGLGDRGPNIKVSGAVKRYGLDHLKPLRDLAGAKVLPLPDFQPLIAELQVHEDHVELLRTLPLATGHGPLSGRALPGSAEAVMEPTFDLAGQLLTPDPNGVDTEGLAALADGGFWVSEEYGPSLLRVGSNGIVTARWTPEGLPLTGAEERLPAAALHRRLNRGFEGLAISADERWLYAVFQSALAGDDPMQTTIWKLDARDGALAGAFSYPFDPPESFPADIMQGEAEADDLKACELVCIGPDQLLVLERITSDARIYRVHLSAGAQLTKTLVFTTDNHPEIAPDLEGVAMLSDHELLLATDSDFGIEGAETRFYRVRYDAPLWDIGA